MMNQLFKFFHGPTKKSRVNTIITNNRLTRTPIRQIPIPEEWNTPEFNRIFLQGWRACERGEEIYNNPYARVENLIYSLHNAWERGYLDCFNTRRTNPQVEELREHFNNTFVEQTREYITDMFNDETQTHGFCAGVHNTQLILHYEGDMDIESVRAMTWDLTNRYANYVSINEHVIGFMENYLNEHLSGTSTIRLA
jgi:hypothetical protein